MRNELFFGHHFFRLIIDIKSFYFNFTSNIRICKRYFKTKNYFCANWLNNNHSCDPYFLYIAIIFIHTLEIIVPYNLINQLPANSIISLTNQSSINWSFYIFIAYTVGFLIMLFQILLSYLKSYKQLSCSTQCHIQGQSVFLNETILSPLSFGFPKGRIYIPANLKEKWTIREIEMCLAHEKIHIDHNDTSWKLLSLTLEALLFFAPWAYILHKRFELEMEIYCDEKTCVKTNANIQEYGDLLLTMTSIQYNNFIFTNIKTLTIKRRLIAMKSKNKCRPLLVSVLSIVMLFAGGAAIATSDGVLMNKSIFKITSQIFIDGKLISTPQIIARVNQKASITLGNTNGNQSLMVALIAKIFAKDTIKVNYDIQYKNGNEKIYSKPEMILVANQEGVIRLSSDFGHSYEMKVIAEKQ